MDITDIRAFCAQLPGAVPDIKWGGMLTFCVAKKMFVTCTPEEGGSGALYVSFKTTPDAFFALTEEPGIEPAPYMAKNKWVRINDLDALDDDAMRELIRQSYDLVVAKLPRRERDKLATP